MTQEHHTEMTTATIPGDERKGLELARAPGFQPYVPDQA